MIAHPDGRATLNRWAGWLIPALALGMFVAPMVLTDSGFMPDWTNHLWLVSRQSISLEAAGPSLYVHADTLGVFYPHFAFYGGTLYALTGSISLLLGDTTIAYILSWSAAFAAAYGGTTWLAMQCGLRGWRAQIPGLFLVTSAYFVTNAYGRGAWPEFVAVAAVPLLVASAARLLRGPWSPLPLLAFVGAAIVFVGSHNITLLYGSLFIIAVGAALAIAAWRRPTPNEVRRFIGVGAISALCIGINLWFLLPDLWYAHRTMFGVVEEPFVYSTQHWLSDLGVLFHPGRVSFPELKGQVGEAIYLQLPVLAFAWIAVALVLMRKSGTPFERRITWGLIAIAVPFALLTATTEPWHWMPNFLRQVQFAYRLESYVIFATTGLLIVALCEISRTSRTVARSLVVTLGGVMVIGSALAVWQVWNTTEFLKDRDDVFAIGNEVPRSWYDGGVYRDNSPETPIIDVPNSRKREIDFEVDAANTGSVSMVIDPPTGPLSTNLAAGAYLIDVEGLVPIGRTQSGLLVLQRPAGVPAGALRVRVSRPDQGAVEAGRIATLVSAIGLLGVIAWTIKRAVVTRRRQRWQGPAPSERSAS